MQTIRIVVITTALLFSSLTYPCSTIYLENSTDHVVAKNLDWYMGQGLVMINKRNVEKTSVMEGAGQPLKWVSKYMSVTYSQTGREFPWEGMNEAGVSVDIMVLNGSEYPAETDPRPVVNGLQWIQYILDTASSTADAIQRANVIRIDGKLAPNEHYFVCDSTGQCAVLEYLAGALVVHSGDGLPYKALTNDSYDSSLTYLKTGLDTRGREAIMSNTSSESFDRFDRSAMWSSGYKATDDAVKYAFSALENVGQNITQWNIVFGLSSRTVHFRSAQAPQIKVIDLKSFDPSCNAPVKMFDINNTKLIGDVSSSFVEYDKLINTEVIEAATYVPESIRLIIESYPEKNTRCIEGLVSTVTQNINVP